MLKVTAFLASHQMTQFSKRTVEYLHRSGWPPDSVIDTTPFKESLSTAGFFVHDAALNFLREFGGLRIQYPHAKVADMEDEMHFDPSIVIRHAVPSDVEAYGRVIGRKLCPIGEACRAYMILMMTEEGEVYGGYDDFFVKVGNSGSEAIEALCSGSQPEIILVGNDWWS